ncbi:MAG TPA: hypothetical protein VMW72_01415 [Sedimentisphaerales bacterium]|nr:hypothetical protein [Sedimentisphaerales bacterium]
MCRKLIYFVSFILVLGLVLTNVARSDDPGWPVNCVRLSPGQTITLDGVVTPQEYDGAQAFIINDQTVNAPDLYLPYIHDAKSAADDNPSLEDFSVTYYFMWDDEFLYVAATANDDNNQQYGITPNHMDCLQFCLAASPQETVQNQIYIPTVAPADQNGNILAKTDFDGFIPAQVAEQSEIAGGVDPDTQDWVIEMAIPWDNMIGDFNADLAKGDSDGNGRNVFPPLFGDVVGFVAFGIDVDSDSAYSFFYCTHDSFPWEGAGLGELRFVEPIGGFGLASKPSPSDGALHGDTWVNLSWRSGDFAVSHDIYIGDDFDDVNNGAEGTFVGNQAGTFIVVGFPGFPYPDGLVPGTTYYWRIDEVNDTDPNSPWKGDVWSFSIPPKTAYFPDPADGAESIDIDVRLSWTGGYGSKLHTVYFGNNFDEVNNATGGQTQGTLSYTPGTLQMAKTYYWRVDEFDAIDTFQGDVWSFTTQGAVGGPNPANGAVDITQSPILTWAHGVFADTHQVYFGTDADAVKNADTSSPEYKGSGNLGSESFESGQLEWNTTYYWRIDEANNTNADSPWTGILWSFTTANFLIVDDFESYNDIDPPDPGSNRVFEAWADGYDIPTNGALVGNDLPPYAEQSIVHSGIQSMPLYYDNSVGYSEATLTLTYPRDWTEKGVNTLTIWFRGNSDNAAEILYVALNGNAIVTNNNPDAAQITTWTQWDIDLQAFADQGVNLANVNTIALGLGNRNNPLAGGSGTMYFDDIRLYPPAP